MLERTRVYVAGPLSKGDRQENVDRAIAAGVELIHAGYAPLIPHLTHYVDGNDSLGHQTWLDVDLPWVSVADALLRLPGESKDADMEVACANRHGIPVFRCLNGLKKELPVQRHAGGHAGFLALLREMRDLHCRKAHDYGTDADPFANVRRSTAVGIEPWRAAVLRGIDKVQRIENYCQGVDLANESLEDSLLDLAAYALIALALRRERDNRAG